MRVADTDRDLLELARGAGMATLGTAPTVSVIATISGRVTVRCERRGRAVAVKVYREPERIEAEVRYRKLAGECEIPLAPELSFTPGPPAVLVTAWVDGESIDRHPGAAGELGRLLAPYYRAQVPPPGAAAGWVAEIRRRAALELRRAAEMGILAARDRAQTAERLAALVEAADQRPQMLIQGDLQPEHVLVDAGGRICAILDWADSGFADPIFEVARVSLHQRELAGPMLEGLGIEADDSLLDGYRTLWELMSATWLAEYGFAS